MNVLEGVRDAGFYAVDVTYKVTSDFYAVSNLVQIFQTVIQLSGRSIFPSLDVGCKFFTNIAKSTYVFQKMQSMATGRAIGTNPHDPNDNRDRIEISEGYYIPNIVKLASTISLFIADAIKTLGTLEEYGPLKLAEIANAIGSISVFGYSLSFMENLNPDVVRGRVAIVGFLFDLSDAARDIYQNGLSVKVVGKIAKDICKIAYVCLKSASKQFPQIPQFETLSWIAYGTGSFIFLIIFVYDHYAARQRPPANG